MASFSTGISHTQIHFIKKLLDAASEQLNFLSHGEQNSNRLENKIVNPVSDVKSSHASLEKQKRLRETAHFQSLLKKLGHEMVHHGTTSVLENFITHELQEMTNNHQLITDYFANKHTLNSLEIKLDQANANKSNLIQELEKKVQEVQLERDSVRLVEECRVRTVKRWEDTRCDQNAIMFHMLEQHLTKELKELDEATDDDRMINFHTERFLENSINDLLETIGQWDDRITQETDDLEISMQQLSERQFKFDKKKKHFEEMYSKHKQVIEEFNEKMRIEKELILMAKCSIKIQAWWRGVMVRKKLGPFKSKPKKKKKKGGKNGRKGNK